MTEKILHFELLERKSRDQFISTIAWDPAIGRQVFIKEPAEEMLASETFISNFKEEGRRVARAQCPNVLTLYDFITEYGPNKTPLMVLEFVEDNLWRRLNDGPIDSAKARRLLREALHALRVIHGAGFCHSNICPKSMLITPEGALKLTNFRASWARTETGTLELHLGRYSPHEALRPGGKVGPWSDLYSLGCVIYECLVGSDDYGKALNCADKFSPKDPTAKGAAFRRWHCDLNKVAMLAHVRRPGVDEQLSLLLARLMEKNIERRISSADEALSALDGMVNDSAPPAEKRKIPTSRAIPKTIRTVADELIEQPKTSRWRDGAVLLCILAIGLSLMSLIVYYA